MTQKEATMPYPTRTGKTTSPEPDPTEWEPYGTSADPAHDVESFWLSLRDLWRIDGAMHGAMLVCGVVVALWLWWGATR